METIGLYGKEPQKNDQSQTDKKQKLDERELNGGL